MGSHLDKALAEVRNFSESINEIQQSFHKAGLKSSAHFRLKTRKFRGLIGSSEGYLLKLHTYGRFGKFPGQTTYPPELGCFNMQLTALFHVLRE